MDYVLYSLFTPGTTDDNVSRCSDNTDDELEEHVAEDGGNPDDGWYVVSGNIAFIVCRPRPLTKSLEFAV